MASVAAWSDMNYGGAPPGCMAGCQVDHATEDAQLGMHCCRSAAGIVAAGLPLLDRFGVVEVGADRLAGEPAQVTVDVPDCALSLTADAARELAYLLLGTADRVERAS